MRWRKVAIIGVGLLGGSLGMALRRRGLAEEVHGHARREQTITEAREIGAIDHGSLVIAEAIRGSDLVVLCTPILRMKRIVLDLVPHLEAGTCVTDVGSVKGCVVEAAEAPVLGARGSFVGSHPMAGSERTGVLAAKEDLFAGAVTVVTPTRNTDMEARHRVVGMWESVGARVMEMTPEVHDELVSRSSHLPHFLAAALARFVLDPEHSTQQGALCATGFRDTTRVASGSPEMWRDIGLGNREAILRALAGMEASLARLRRALEEGDGAGVEAFLRSAKERRDDWGGAGGRAIPE